MTTFVFVPPALSGSRASCLADWQETTATVGQTIHADFTWSGAFYNPNQGFYATMSIWDPNNQQKASYTEQYTGTGTHTLSYTANIAGSWKAYIFVYTGFSSSITDDDYLTVTASPQLAYSPTTINFGTHDQGWTGSSTFQIWNSGGGTLTYSLSENIPWITSVNPSSGSSTGEHDTITVYAGNTGGMSGYYSGYINIASNGGSGSVFVDITINQPAQPVLAYSPTTINFGTHNQGWIGTSTFDVWNSGSGTLTYSFSENIPWITSINPSSGSSTGEHDYITVNVGNTAGMSGYYSGYINIASNGGSGSILVDITINEQQNPPNVPSNPYPSNNSGNIPVVAILSWTGGDPDNDAVTYDLYISMCPRPDYFSAYAEDITTDEYLIWLSVDTTYYWRVVATDEHEAQSVSPIWTFSTKTTGQTNPAVNSPPNTPTHTISSMFIDRGDLLVFTATATDPDGDKVNLYWDFDGDDLVDNESLNATSGIPRCILYIWYKPAGVYNVRVIATDIFGKTSQWSSSLTLIVNPAGNNKPPTIPVAPAGDSTGFVGQPYTFSTVSFDANDEQGGNEDKISYQWDWGDGTISEWMGSFSSGVTVTASHSWAGTGNYNIKVKAKDLNGCITSWSTPTSIYVVTKGSATIFNQDDFCGFTYGDIFDNFPGQGRLIYANGYTGAIATGAYGGFPFGASWSTACQGVQFHIGRQKPLTINAEISYIGGTPSLAYSCIKKIIKVDGPYKPEQEYVREIQGLISSVEDLQLFCNAAIGLLKNGVYTPSKGLQLYKLVETTNWVTNHISNYPYHAEIADQLVNEFNAVSRMGNQGKLFYNLAWKEVQMDGAFIPEGVSLEANTNTLVKSTTAGQPTAVLGKLALVLQVSLELWTLYELMNHWQVDTLLEEFENSGQAQTINVENTFTFEPGDHTVWAGLQTEAYGAAIFFGFAYAAGLVKSITIEGIAPPDKPYLTWPDNIHVLQNIPFVAHGSDQNGDPIQYEIDWGDGTTLTTQPVASGESVDVPHRYTKVQTYVITIKSIDCDGMVSEVNTYTLHVPLDLTQQSTPQSQPTPQGQPTPQTQTFIKQQGIIPAFQKIAMSQKQ